jgi:methyl-accepting chemotaxis protein
MTQRKKYIIDRKFQLKAAFSVIGVTAAVSLIIIAAIAASIVYNNDKISNIYEIENNIFQLMQDTTINCSDNGNFGDMSVMLQRNHEQNQHNINKITHYNRLLLVSLVLCVVFQGIILFIMIIKITHRISGPVYVMSGYMKEIIDGRLPSPRNLRDKDGFKDFYELFRDMVEALRSREEKHHHKDK